FICIYSALVRHRDLHSFPTRRSSDLLSYLYICKTINIFDAGRNKDKLEDSFLKIEGKLHLIAFKDDMLFFPNEMEEIRDIMIKIDRKSTRLNSSHVKISYAVFCLKKK